VPVARVFNVWNVPEYGQSTPIIWILVSDVLAAGKDFAALQAARYDEQVATSVNCGINPNEIGASSLLERRRTRGAGAINKDVQDELDRFLKDGQRRKSWSVSRQRMKQNLVRGLDRIGGFGGKSDILARGRYSREIRNVLICVDRVRKATAQDLRDAARRWLSDGLYQLEVTPYPEYKTASAGATVRSSRGRRDAKREAAGVRTHDALNGLKWFWRNVMNCRL